MTPVKPRHAGTRGWVACTHDTDAASRASGLPTQREAHRIVLPVPDSHLSWEGYSNAGPDVYWTPDTDGLSLS